MNSNSMENQPLGDISMNKISWYNEKRHDPSTEVVYDYSDLNVNPKQQISKTIASDGYVRVLFSPDQKITTPHLFFSKSPTQLNRYYVSAINIFVVPDPKIVIENKPLTNGLPIYIHIPLVTRTDGSKSIEKTWVDKLLNGTDQDVSININSLLGPTSAAFFEGQSIFLTKKSISIYTVLDEDNEFFKNAVTPSNWNGITINKSELYSFVEFNVIGSKTKYTDVVEGYEGDEDMDGDIYDCSPLDVGADNIAFMQVPFFSQNVGSQVSLNMLQGMIYLFYLGIVVILCIFVIPNVYTFDFSKITGENQSKILFLENMIPLSFCLGGTGMILEATLIRESMHEINAGILITIFSFCFWITIQALKKFKPEKLEATNGVNMFTEWFSVLSGCIYYFFGFLVFFWFIIGYLVLQLKYGAYPYMIFFYGTLFSAGFSFILFSLFMLKKQLVQGSQ